MNEPTPKGVITRAADGTYDLTTTEPRAVVRVRFTGRAPGAGNPLYERVEYLGAANQPSSVLAPMLELRGVHLVEILSVALVCEACHHAADGLVHTGC